VRFVETKKKQVEILTDVAPDIIGSTKEGHQESHVAKQGRNHVIEVTLENFGLRGKWEKNEGGCLPGKGSNLSQIASRD